MTHLCPTINTVWPLPIGLYPNGPPSRVQELLNPDLASIGTPALLPRTAQAAMRHSTIDLTMNVYTDPRLLDVARALEALPGLGSEIAKLSNSIIDRRLSHDKFDDKTKAVIRRIIHATADFSFAQSVRVGPDAIERGCAALEAGCAIICDVNMVRAGITSVSNEVLCEIKSKDVIETAKEKGITRAAAAMEKLKGRLEGSIVVIGNAPTALFRVMEIAKTGPKPALVIGLPVGFVGARESKLALIESGLSYISNTNFRGGSPVAAAALNAVAYLQKEDHE